jgi:hypothetical protein
MITMNAASSMVTVPMEGETISDPNPVIKANLATFGAVDPKSVEMRVSGIGIVPAKYDPETKMVEAKIAQSFGRRITPSSSPLRRKAGRCRPTGTLPSIPAAPRLLSQWPKLPHVDDTALVAVATSRRGLLAETSSRSRGVKFGAEENRNGELTIVTTAAFIPVPSETGHLISLTFHGYDRSNSH